MNENDKIKFAEFFYLLCEVFSKETSKPLVKVYFETLKQFSLDQVEEGISKAIASLKFFPKPVEVTELITGNAGRLEDIAEVEASKVLQAVKQYGAYKSIQFDDPVTAAVIVQGFGSWCKLCEDLKANSELWFRKDFARIYQAYARQNIRHEGILIGLIEAENSAHGYDDHIPEPVQIGETETVKKIREKNENHFRAKG